jgi:transcriptional regulator with XRE-family HTH domain
MTFVKLNVNHGLLANVIREHRLKRSLSQEQLALMANVSLRTVQRLENAGKCSHETLLALADVFEVDVREFTEI